MVEGGRGDEGGEELHELRTVMSAQQATKIITEWL